MTVMRGLGVDMAGNGRVGPGAGWCGRIGAPIMPPMSQAKGAIKWAIYMIALLVIGPLAAGPLASLRDVSGGHEATVLISTSLAAGVLAGVIPIVAAGAVGLVTARLIGPRHGMLSAGLVLARAAWRSASIDGLMRATRDGGAMLPLAGEGALLGLAGVLLGAAIWVAGGDPARDRLHAPAPSGADRADAPIAPARRVWLLITGATGAKGGGIAAILAGLAAGGVVAWMVALEPLKGQTIFAAMLAGVAAGGFGRAVTARDEKPSPMAALIAMTLLACIGPISALVMNGGSRVVGAAIGGDLFTLAMPMPLDWLAGAFWGIPIGLSWAESMVEKPATA